MYVSTGDAPTTCAQKCSTILDELGPNAFVADGTSAKKRKSDNRTANDLVICKASQTRAQSRGGVEIVRALGI